MERSRAAVLIIGVLGFVASAVHGQVYEPTPVRDTSPLSPVEATLASQACCDLTTNDRTCFDDELGIGSVCLAPATGLGVGTTCAADCPCGDTCNTCVGKESGNLASVEITLVDTSFDGVNTTFSYRVCQYDGPALSHWVLGMDDVCCGRIVSASGGSTTQMCADDPTSDLFGLKFDTSPPPLCPEQPCSGTGDLFTVVISGNVPVGCTKVATKAASTEDTATSCIQGPNCTSLCEGVDCSPMNTDCETFTCNPDSGLCEGTLVPDLTPCTDDNRFCTGAEVCIGGLCSSPGDPCGGDTPICCESLDRCEEECCRASDCVDDGLFCNGGQTCVGGICQPTGNPCTGPTPICCEADRTCTEECCIDADCADDGFSCTDAVCEAGQCVSVPFDDRCQPGNACVDGVCDPADPNADASGCVFVPAPLSTPCESDIDECTVEHCDGAGNCVLLSEDDCSRLDTVCETFTCDPGSGECIGTPAPFSTPCEADDDLCTEDHCDGAGNCVLLNDRYQDCICAEDCTSCNPATGVCEPSVDCDGVACADDGFACTRDECVDGECTHTPIAGACDDGNVCTEDVCDPLHMDADADGCVFTPLPLSTPCETDTDLCTTQHCDGNGECAVLETTDCSNLDTECETFACDPGTGECVGTPEPIGKPCNVAGGDLCVFYACDDNGECTVAGGGGVDCSCTEDCTECNPATGECEPSAGCDGSPCPDDGFACTEDRCVDGVCTHTPIVDFCGGGNECTQGVCDPDNPEADVDGCVIAPLPLSTPCEADGDLCTEDHCDGEGNCVLLNDRNESCSCEVNCSVCNPANGQCSPSFSCNDVVCGDDGFACTASLCSAGVCEVTIVPGACDDMATCSDEFCNPFHPNADPQTGCVNERNHERCDDGTACTDNACAPGAPGADPVTGCLFIDNGTCGPCCDQSIQGGACTDGVEPGDCVGPQLIHFPGETCDVVEAEGRCPEHTGACCDRRIADPAERCRDDVPESECIIDDPNQVRWFKFTSCADLSPEECSEHTGACCDELSGTCTDNVPESVCREMQPDAAQRNWTKDTPCSEATCVPAVGACCNADAGPLATEGICKVTTLAECQCEKCIWTKGGSCDAIDCQPNFVAIPTVSEWGLLILTLLLLIGAKLYFGAHAARHEQPA